MPVNFNLSIRMWVRGLQNNTKNKDPSSVSESHRSASRYSLIYYMGGSMGSQPPLPRGLLITLRVIASCRARWVVYWGKKSASLIAPPLRYRLGKFNPGEQAWKWMTHFFFAPWVVSRIPTVYSYYPECRERARMPLLSLFSLNSEGMPKKGPLMLTREVS